MALRKNLENTLGSDEIWVVENLNSNSARCLFNTSYLSQYYLHKNHRTLSELASSESLIRATLSSEPKFTLRLATLKNTDPSCYVPSILGFQDNESMKNESYCILLFLKYRNDNIISIHFHIRCQFLNLIQVVSTNHGYTEE